MRELLSKRLESGESLVSQNTFKILVWVGLGLCILSLIIRGTIRYVCFRRFLIEDALMVFGLCCITACAILLELYIPDLYTLYQVEKGYETPSDEFVSTLLNAVRADGLVILLAYTGIWAVKVNFLMFFYRLTGKIRLYLISWWMVTVVIVACYVSILGVIPWKCTFGTFAHMTGVCASSSGIKQETIDTKVGVALDVFSDFVLITFPIIVLWRSRINLNQKLVLSCIFSVELFTIAVAIVRGSVWGEQSYSVVHGSTVQAMDFVWILFWQYIELIVSFFVACTVSFRSLWISREQKARDQRYELYKKHNATPPDHQTIGSHTKHQQQQTASRRRRNKWDHFYDSVLETLNGLEAGGGGGGAGGVGTMVVERGGVVMDDSSSSAYVQLAGSGSGRGTPQYPSPEPPQKAVLAEYCSRLGSCKRNGAIMPQPMRTRHDGESLEIESI